MSAASTIPNPRPARRPERPFFSSGPCAKRPGWSLAELDGAMLGRSHRATRARAQIRDVIERSRRVLGVPEGWRVGVVPGSDTGAVEMALWSLVGPRGVDVLAFESFSAAWAYDLEAELRPAHGVRVLEAPYGQLPDLAVVDWQRDVVFAWNGTTSGVRVPDGEWIAPGRAGLAICDATSAAFAMELPWDRLDVVTWSWQKVLGGEAGHGMIALSPRAAERLRAPPPRPLPKLFRMASRGEVIEGIFAGDTINTPSMLCVADAIDGLAWAERIGGLPALIARTERNLQAVARWVDASPWARFLCADPGLRSPTAIAIATGFDRATAARAAGLLEAEGVAFDILAYRDAPPGFRIWGGATVETADIEALLPWLNWAVGEAS